MRADYFARRITNHDLTGITSTADNDRGLADAHTWLCQLDEMAPRRERVTRRRARLTLVPMWRRPRKAIRHPRRGTHDEDAESRVRNLWVSRPGSTELE